MSIKLGTQNIIGLYKGNTEIVKRYKGSNLIYESLLPYSFEYLYNSLVPQYMNKSKIPEEYQEIKYIESTGTQYIDTGLVPSVNHSFSIKFSVGYLGNCVAFGSRTSGNYASSLNQIYLNVTNNNEIKLFNIFGTNDLVLNDNVEANTIFTYKNIQNNNFQLSSPSQPYYIFTLNNMGSPSTISNIKMYYFKIYDNNILVRDFVPCYRKSDNVIGLYDKVNSVFYTNAGTGTFLKGNDVKLTVKDKAQVNTIYGNSVVENQQFKINSTDQTRTLNGITMTDNRDGSYTFNGTATSETILDVGGSIPTINIGDKYLVFGGAKGGSSTTYFLTQNSSGANDYGNGAVYTQPDNQYGRFLCVVIRNGVTVNNLVVKPQHISLTQWYPFNTPTTLTDTRVQSIINRGNIPYNTGTLKSVNIGEFVSEPYNLFDGIFERGDIDSSTGEETTDNRFIRNDNFIKVIAGQTYSLEQFDFTFLTSAQRKIVQFDENRNIIKATTNYNNASQFANPYTITLESNCRYVRIVYYNAATQIPLDLKCAFHLTGTRTGYAPYTQPYTLPFIYQGNSALNAHDTLEITNTEYVFTKNVNNIIYNGNANENWQEYGSGSQRFTILNNLWSSPSSTVVANILCDRLQTYAKNEIFNKEYAISGSDDNVNYFIVRINDSITDVATLKSWLSNNPINVNYELVTPQVTRIPRKHLAVVDLGSLNWAKTGYGWYSYKVDLNVKPTIDNGTMGNIYCAKYISGSSNQVQGSSNDTIAVDNASYILFRDNSTSNMTQADIREFLSGTYLFYETQDEVTDIISDINIEAGGTLTSNWFSWVENQLVANGNFETNASGWGALQGTNSVSDNTLTFTAANTITNTGCYTKVLENGTTANHKYLVSAKIKASVSTTTTRIVFDGVYNDNPIFPLTADTWLDFSRIYSVSTPNTNTGVKGYLYFYYSQSGEEVASGSTLSVKKVMCIDLTLAFGAGKEPTSINDPRIQYIIKQGYIPTNTTGTNKTIASEVLPNIDASFNRK